MTEPPTDPAGAVQPSEPALLAVLDACEEYVREHHQLLRAASRTSLTRPAMQPLAAHLDQLDAAVREARRLLPPERNDTP